LEPQRRESREAVKVFCASMADVFEDEPGLAPWRDRLWGLIEATPWLAWQLLTKRPENVARMAPWGAEWPANVWLGTSIENSRFTFRADLLREIPARIRFVSAEPLLDSLFRNGRSNRRPLELDGIDWLIAGGESGHRARPSQLDWFRELRDACADQGVAFFLKQLGGAGDKRGGDKAVLDGERRREIPQPLVPS
jgi:protein gp37